MSNLFDAPPTPTGLPPGVTPEQADATVTDESVSPEEQAQYDQFVTKAAKFIYAQPEKVVASLNDKGKAVHEVVGRVAAQIANAVQDSAKAAGATISPDVLWHGGTEIVEILMDLGTQAKVLPLDQESDEYQQVAAMSLMEAEKIYGEKFLREDPKRAALAKEEAADQWAHGIAQEVDAGQADPRYLEQVQQMRQSADPVAAGVKRALGGGGG